MKWSSVSVLAAICAILWLAVIFFFFAGCKPALTPADTAELAEYQAEQLACIHIYAPDKAKIDDCRDQVKAFWAARWNERFDGGFDAMVHRDAGAE